MIDLTPSIHFEHDRESGSMRWQIRLDEWVWNFTAPAGRPEAFFNKIVFPKFIEAAVAEGFYVTTDGRLTHLKLEYRGGALRRPEMKAIFALEQTRRAYIDKAALQSFPHIAYSIKSSPEEWS